MHVGRHWLPDPHTQCWHSSFSFHKHTERQQWDEEREVVLVFAAYLLSWPTILSSAGEPLCTASTGGLCCPFKSTSGMHSQVALGVCSEGKVWISRASKVTLQCYRVGWDNYPWTDRISGTMRA